jgi:hypothetical protein
MRATSWQLFGIDVWLLWICDLSDECGGENVLYGRAVHGTGGILHASASRSGALPPRSAGKRENNSIMTAVTMQMEA